MVKYINENLHRIFNNYGGVKINRKIVVIESDDWGSIRIPDRKSLLLLKNFGIKVEKCGYVLNDALEDNYDLETLIDLLDNKKRAPIITANFLTANPDFNKIKESDFQKYYYQTIHQTIASLPDRDKVLHFYSEGIRNRYIKPQLHGREHLNIARWMNDLRSGNNETMFAFNLNTFGISANTTNIKRQSYQAVFDGLEFDSINSHKKIIEDAVIEFERLFNFKSITFIAPNYIWDDKIEKITSELGIKYLQGGNYHRFFSLTRNRHQRIKHNLGSINNFGQYYLNRNCFFEPYSDLKKDWVNSCLKDIKTAFVFNKPAVISMHRVNFIGSINPENRDRNLKLFSILIDEIIKKWPDVEFLSTDQLAQEIL